MANILQQCFPEIRTREAVIREISESEKTTVCLGEME